MLAMLFASQFYPGTKPEFLWLMCGLVVGIDQIAHRKQPAISEGSNSIQ
jgi:hypothetical protein